MSDRDLQDGVMPDEELNINGPDVKVHQDIEQVTYPPMEGSIGDLGLQADISDDEMLERVLQASPAQLIPWEDCRLPSNGLYYGWPDGIVSVRGMGQNAEKVLATQRLAQTGQSIDYLFRECCRFPDGFDPVDLLLGDRVYLLYFLRGITYGNLYEFAVTCSACGANNTHTYDFNQLISTVREANPALGTEPFRVVLPYLSRVTKREFWVGVRFLRARDATDMLSRRKFKKKVFAKPGNTVRNNPLKYGRGAGAGQVADKELDDTITDNLERIIVSVMGRNDIFTIRGLIEKLHGLDTTAIRDWLRDNTPGIDNTVLVTCPDCDAEFKVELPITENFFRPAKQ